MSGERFSRSKARPRDKPAICRLVRPLIGLGTMRFSSALLAPSLP